MTEASSTHGSGDKLYLKEGNGRPKRRRKGNIKMDYKNRPVECQCVEASGYGPVAGSW
jgi:hypothetical protein